MAGSAVEALVLGAERLDNAAVQAETAGLALESVSARLAEEAHLLSRRCDELLCEVKAARDALEGAGG